MCVGGEPGSVAEAMIGYMQTFGLPHEVGSSLRTGPVSPSFPLYFPASPHPPPLPWRSQDEAFPTSFSGQQGPAGVTAFSLLISGSLAGLQTAEDLPGTVAVFKSKHECCNQGSYHDLGGFLSLLKDSLRSF